MFVDCPCRQYATDEPWNAKRCRRVLDIDEVRRELKNIHKEVSKNNKARCTSAQVIRNAKTNVLPLNINIGGYVTMRVCSKCTQKLQPKWKVPMRVIKAKGDLLFLLEDLNDARNRKAHAQRLVPYPLTTYSTQAWSERKQQVAHYNMTYHLVDAIKHEQKRGGEFEV